MTVSLPVPPPPPPPAAAAAAAAAVAPRKLLLLSSSLGIQNFGMPGPRDASDPLNFKKGILGDVLLVGADGRALANVTAPAGGWVARPFPPGGFQSPRPPKRTRPEAEPGGGDKILCLAGWSR